MGESDFMEAVKAGESERVRSLMQADPALARARDSQGVSAILRALYQGHGELAEELAGQAGDLDVFEAAAMGRLQRVRDLAAADGARTAVFSPDGFTPLGLAAYFGRVATVAWLLEQGVDPNTPAANPSKIAPLHAAVAHRGEEASLEIARLLLDAGACADAVQAGGIQPLHAAAAHGRVELATLLRKRGASVDSMGDDGRTALDHARERGQDDMVAFLQKDPD